MKKYAIIYVFFALFAFAAPVLRAGGLGEAIDEIIASADNKNADFAVYIYDPNCGRALYSRKAEQRMIPASNMKIIVSAAAMKLLGADFEYITKVALKDSELIVIGSGDPLLGDKITDTCDGETPFWHFDRIVAALEEKGVTSLENIVVDSFIFDDMLVHPNWPKDQLNRSYAAEVCGLNYNANCIEVTTARLGNICRVSHDPPTGYVQIVDKTSAISKGSTTVGDYRIADSPNKIVVFGKCNRSYSFDVAIQRPSAFFGYLMAENLIAAGIGIDGRIIEKDVENGGNHTLVEFKTPLIQVLRRCNEDSFGLAADALVKTISAHKKESGKGGSWGHGLECIADYLVSLGVGREQFSFDDGRGLSRLNKITPAAIVAVLNDVYEDENWLTYRYTLAKGGSEGTIEKYFREPEYAGKVYGKTGYINGVRTFSGCCETSQGDVIFSILTEGGNWKVRKSINDIVKAIIDNR